MIPRKTKSCREEKWSSSASKKASRSEYLPTEEEEQIALFSWAASMSGAHPELDLMYHIPNGGSRRPMEAMYLKASGVRPGVPDICLPCARGGYHALYIELKRRKNGQVRPTQREMILRLEALGNAAVVCRGADEAIRTIEWYLSGAVEGRR